LITGEHVLQNGIASASDVQVVGAAQQHKTEQARHYQTRRPEPHPNQDASTWDSELSQDFTGALQEALKRRGMVPADLVGPGENFGSHYLWAIGKNTPSRQKSLENVAKLEQTLRLPEGLLASRVKLEDHSKARRKPWPPPPRMYQTKKHRPEPHPNQDASTWNTELPDDFATAYREVIRRRGLVPVDMRRVSTTACNWACANRGKVKKGPSLPRSLPMLHEIEKHLNLPEGLLSKRVTNLGGKGKNKKPRPRPHPNQDPATWEADLEGKNFVQALLEVIERRGKLPFDLHHIVSSNLIRAWNDGTYVPRLRTTGTAAAKIERELKLPEGMLVSRLEVLEARVGKPGAKQLPRPEPHPEQDASNWMDLPTGFADCLAEVLKRRGLIASDLRAIHERAYLWALGRVTPKMTNKNVPMTKALEIRLGLPEGTLTSRAIQRRTWDPTHPLPRPVIKQLDETGVVLQLRYCDLLERVNKENPPGKETRSHRDAALRMWLDSMPKKPAASALIGPELVSPEFDRRLTELAIASQKDLPEKTWKNRRIELHLLQRFYRAWSMSAELPADFCDALAVIIDRKGLLPIDLRKISGESAYAWSMRLKYPSPRSFDKVVELEKALGIPKGVLTSRMRTDATPLLADELSEDQITPLWHRHNAKLCKFDYRWRYDEWPEQLRAIWDALVDHKRLSEHTIDMPDGTQKSFTLEPWQVWHKDASIKKRMEALGGFFGFLTLPLPPKGWGHWENMAWDDRLLYGMGLKPAELKFTHCLDLYYLKKYFRWARSRSYDEHAWKVEEFRQRAIARGEVPPPSVPVDQKTLSDSMQQFLIFCNNMVNKAYSFVRTHYDLLKHEVPGVEREAWDAWCSNKLLNFRGDFPDAVRKTVTQKISRSKRLSPFLRAKYPAAVLYRLIDIWRLRMAPPSSPVWRALDVQYIAILELLTWLPLRVENVSNLRIGHHITIAKDGTVRLRIAKGEFKNWIWGYAQDVDMVIPEEHAAPLREWLQVYRPTIPGSEKTEWVFIRCAMNGGTRKGMSADQDHRGLKMLNRTITQRIGDRSKQYIGIRITPHDWRMLKVSQGYRMGLATATGQALLNDSPRVVEDIYRATANADEEENINRQAELEREAVRNGASITKKSIP
jgi:hypothetical protein